jgi:dTDP-4-dehydrorhamnose 3,5-epimerase
MGKQFRFINTPLEGLIKIERNSISDHRGYFSRSYCKEELKEIDCNESIAQANFTLTRKKGSIRGMHFQYPPHSETKIVTCSRGKVIDIVIDIRKESATFLQWHAEELSESSHISLYIPKGFAHGFQTLTDDCQLMYFHTSFYEPKSERVINAFDPLFKIEWPLMTTEISERDENATFLDPKFKGLDTDIL